jgi:hypothetical protein
MRVPPFIILTLNGGVRSASLSDRFNIGKIAPGTHWIENYLGPKAGLEAIQKRKILCRESKHDSSVAQLVA